jgi:hypothetical protein
MAREVSKSGVNIGLLIEPILREAGKTGIPVFIGFITPDGKHASVTCGFDEDGDVVTLGLELARAFRGVMKDEGYPQLGVAGA